MEKLGKAIGLDEYFDLIYRKTACLFSVCMRLGAILGGATEAQEKALGSTVTTGHGVSNRGRCARLDRIRRCSRQASGQRFARGQGDHGGDPRAGAMHHGRTR